mgnify:CR=1 FL=1
MQLIAKAKIAADLKKAAKELPAAAKDLLKERADAANGKASGNAGGSSGQGSAGASSGQDSAGAASKSSVEPTLKVQPPIMRYFPVSASLH